MDDMEKLKPCPFCGVEYIEMDKEGRDWSIYCLNEDCGAEITKDDAPPIAAWNSRDQSGWNFDMDKAPKESAVEYIVAYKWNDKLMTACVIHGGGNYNCLDFDEDGGNIGATLAASPYAWRLPPQPPKEPKG